jgi:hypothetical protein
MTDKLVPKRSVDIEDDVVEKVERKCYNQYAEGMEYHGRKDEAMTFDKWLALFRDRYEKEFIKIAIFEGRDIALDSVRAALEKEWPCQACIHNGDWPDTCSACSYWRIGDPNRCIYQEIGCLGVEGDRNPLCPNCRARRAVLDELGLGR